MKTLSKAAGELAHLDGLAGQRKLTNNFHTSSSQEMSQGRGTCVWMDKRELCLVRALSMSKSIPGFGDAFRHWQLSPSLKSTGRSLDFITELNTSKIKDLTLKTRFNNVTK